MDQVRRQRSVVRRSVLHFQSGHNGQIAQNHVVEVSGIGRENVRFLESLYVLVSALDQFRSMNPATKTYSVLSGHHGDLGASAQSLVERECRRGKGGAVQKVVIV